MSDSGGVVLEPAGRWNCPYCERENNFTPLYIKEFGIGEAAEYARERGVEPEEMRTGDWVVVPPDVCCDGCHNVFNVNGMWCLGD